MQPIFIPSQNGPLFAMFYPTEGNSVSNAILHIPAFGEEMNKTRRIVAVQAKRFSALNQSVLVIDLFGTGDSAGEFHEATWSIWLENIDTAINWLKGQGAQTISLWGLRTGVLLAMDFISRSKYEIEQLLAWQPVFNGESFVDQLLRLRVAAAMFDARVAPENVTTLKQRLMSGQSLEVAGYLLSPELILPLMTLKAEQLDLSTVNKVDISDKTFL